MNSGLRLGAGVCLAALAVVAMADVPREMTFQGRLSGNGTGPVDIEVRFYDAETGGNLLWSETHPSVARPEGLFTINIGSQTTGGIPAAALPSATDEVWLSVSVNQGAELTPRQRVTAAAYSLNTRGVFVDEAGNVGIGAPSTGGRLEVGPAGGTEAELWLGDRLVGSPGASFDVDEMNQGDLRLQSYRSLPSTYGNVLINPLGGYVGIGLPDPPSPLSVAGWVFSTAGVSAGPDPTGRFGGTFGYDGQGFIELRGNNSPNNGPYIDFAFENDTSLDFDVRMRVSTSRALRLYSANGPGAMTLDVQGTTVSKILQITGGSDLAEPAEVSDAGQGAEAIQPGMVVSIDPKNPGKLMLATEAYDRKVAGVISGAGGVQPGMIMKQEGHPTAEGEHPIAMAGKVYVWCDADANGPIQPGDLLTTSNTPGHAMRADHTRDFPRGCVIGKAMTVLKEGKGLVLLLVQPQ